jgi:hypothetical protein
MTEEKRNDHLGLLGELIVPLLRLLWLDVLGGVWKTLLKAMPGQSHEGLYRVQATDSVFDDQRGRERWMWLLSDRLILREAKGPHGPMSFRPLSFWASGPLSLRLRGSCLLVQ